MTETLRGCEDARLLASRELDGELDAAGLARLEAHLATCAACRSERAGLERIDGLLEDAFEGHPFDERLVREIVRMAEARTARPAPVAEPRGVIVKFRATGLVAAAAIVLVAVGVGLLAGGETKDDAPVAARAVVAHAHGAGLRVGSAANDGPAPLAVREDEIVVNNQGAGTLLLEDGTRVDLRPDTAVALHREQDGGITVQIGPRGTETKTGAVFCEVSKQKHRPFRVMTGTLTAEVLGTKFLVRAMGGESAVSVIEGRVLVRLGRKDVVLSHDQEAVVEDAQPILLPRPIADARQILAWNRRVLEALPAPAAPAHPIAPVNSARPTAAPSGPTAPDGLDAPVEKPGEKPLKNK